MTDPKEIVRAVCPSYQDRSRCSYPDCHQRGGAVSAFCSVAADIAIPAFNAGMECAAKLAEGRAAYWEARPPTVNHDGKPELGPSLHAFEDRAIAAALRNQV